jgi:ketosteroid isomerase-like protein
MQTNYSPNIEWIQPGESAVSGTYHDKGELGEYISRLAEKSTTVNPHRFLADGDTIVVLSETTASGETSQDADVFTLRDGKIVRAQVCGDTAIMERVFGKKAARGRVVAPTEESYRLPEESARHPLGWRADCCFAEQAGARGLEPAVLWAAVSPVTARRHGLDFGQLPAPPRRL